MSGTTIFLLGAMAYAIYERSLLGWIAVVLLAALYLFMGRKPGWT